MADFYTDLNGAAINGSAVRSTQSAYGATTTSVRHTTNDKASLSLDMPDFLQLMVATFQNQTIDNTADISDMMNQMVQMSVIQTITNLNTLITQTTNLSYAASLVGKNVVVAHTIGRETQQIAGIVTGTGTLDGEQVIFLGNDTYKLSDILAVGQLPDADAVLAGVNEEEDNAAAEIRDEWERNDNAAGIRGENTDAAAEARNAGAGIRGEAEESVWEVREEEDADGYGVADAAPGN